MKYLRELLEHMRARNRCALRHSRILRHAHHAAHSGYFGWYVFDWHAPLSIFCLVLLAGVIASWVAPNLHLE